MWVDDQYCYTAGEKAKGRGGEGEGQRKGCMGRERKGKCNDFLSTEHKYKERGNLN